MILEVPFALGKREFIKDFVLPYMISKSGPFEKYVARNISGLLIKN